MSAKSEENEVGFFLMISFIEKYFLMPRLALYSPSTDEFDLCNISSTSSLF